MGKTAFQIQMDFAKALAQASELDEIADKLQSLANSDLQDCMTQIGVNWTGENSQKYLAKCETLKGKIQTSSSQIKKTASTIRIIAKNTYDAEMAAVIIAQS